MIFILTYWLLENLNIINYIFKNPASVLEQYFDILPDFIVTKLWQDIFIEVQLIYNMLIIAAQQDDSVIYLYIYNSF